MAHQVLWFGCVRGVGAGALTRAASHQMGGPVTSRSTLRSRLPLCLAQNYSTMDTSWRRPEGLPFPKAWRHCSGKMKLADSTVTQFRIQDVPEDLFDDVIQHMTDELLQDEPMFAALRIVEDPASIREMQDIWRQMLHQRVSLVALVDEPGTKRPKVAGCNVCGVVSKESQANPVEPKGRAVRGLMAALEYMDSRADVFTRYEVSHYLTGMGLSIARAYRGQGVGKELLRARLDLCRAVGVPLTVTLFSGPASQAVAHTLGMELLVDLPYAQYLPGGRPGFPGASGAMMLMAKKIE